MEYPVDTKPETKQSTYSAVEPFAGGFVSHLFEVVFEEVLQQIVVVACVQLAAQHYFGRKLPVAQIGSNKQPTALVDGSLFVDGVEERYLQ